MAGKISIVIYLLITITYNTKTENCQKRRGVVKLTGESTITDKFYTFDHLARLTTSAQQITGDAANGKVTVALNTYNESGQLINKKLHGANSLGYLQYVDYTYNIRGWLTSINNPDNLAHSTDPVDLFGERLDYNATETGLNSSYPSQYNGNISAMVWTNSNKPKRGYAFTYDGLNRLTYGDFKGYNAAWVDSTNFEEKSLSYDLNGNLNRLIRTNSTGGSMADYTYHYKGNQLNQINALTAYTYDKNGNTTFDGIRGFTIGYNSLNLPKSVTSGTDNIAYIYSAAGTKLAKKMKDNTYHYYAGNMMYNTDKSLNYLLFEEGIVYKSSGGYTYEYHLKDHLGNTRVAFQPNGTGGKSISQFADYYPFGSSYTYYASGTNNQYLYNGKELQDDVLNSTTLDWYDYGARFYDPIIGRWHSVDPLAELGRRWSPYNYGENNPIRNIDPDGMEKKEFFNPNSKDASHFINAYNKSKDDKAIHIWAHGSQKSITVYDGKKDVVLTSAKDFAEFLSKNSTTWQNRGENDQITIVLHACETGKEDDNGQSIASEISGLKNTTVIAPSEKDVINSSDEELGSYSTEEVTKGDNITNETVISSEGQWNEFNNGILTDSHPADYKPHYMDPNAEDPETSRTE